MHLAGFSPTGLEEWDSILRQLEKRAQREPPPKPRGVEKLAILKAMLTHLYPAPPRKAALQQPIPMVHVAGSVGKGLSAAMIAQLLRHHGKPFVSAQPSKPGPNSTPATTSAITSVPAQVGLFTSPHILRLEERIQLNNQPMPLKVLAKAGRAVFCAETSLNPLASFFDLMTLIAWVAFGLEKVDWAVLETGLGGMADATNAIDEKCCAVITRIGYDHQAQLGNNLQSIAQQKLGIARPAVPLVLAAQPPALMRWLQAQAKSMRVGALYEVPAKHRLKAYHRAGVYGVVLPNGQRIPLPPLVQPISAAIPQKQPASTAQPSSMPAPLPRPVTGFLTDIRLQCLATAMLAVKACLAHGANKPAQRGFALSPSSPDFLMEMAHTPAQQNAIAQALCTPWPGRLHIVEHQPTPKDTLRWVLLDGAHNPPALRALYHQLRAWRLPPLQLILAMHTDKLTSATATPLLRLLKLASLVWLPSQPAQRFATPQCIQTFVSQACHARRKNHTHSSNTMVELPTMQPTTSTAQALQHAAKAAQTPAPALQPVVITGSLWLVGQVLEQLQAWQTTPQRGPC